jgi:hypothetical protein
MNIGVVIPLHKSIHQLNKYELKSLKNNISVLYNHITIIVAPEHLRSTIQQDFFLHGIKIEHFLYFADSYFDSIRDYNRLLTSVNFYKCFLKFDYIFICQLDVWVFKDELSLYCEFGDSYIGGLCFEEFDIVSKWSFDSVLGPINGGASLRNVRDHLRLLSKITVWGGLKNLLKDLIINIFMFKLGMITRIPERTTRRVIGEYLKQGYNEDFIFYMASKNVSGYKFGSLDKDKVWLFSWDVAPWVCYDALNALPMAAHAWFRNDFPYNSNIDFWNEFIIASESTTQERS